MISCTFPDGDKGNLRHVTVNAIAVKDDKILLTKRVETLSDGGKYCLPGGFLSRDENLEEGILREVLEETGYTAEKTTLFYVNDNPNRGENQNVCFVFLVEVIDKVAEHDWEVTEVKWFPLNTLPVQADLAFDHYEVINLFLKYRKYSERLPLFFHK